MRILILLFGVLAPYFTYSQIVSIELSIEWRLESVYLKKFIPNQKEPVPYLVITYRNLSEENVFLKELFSNQEYFLPNAWASLINTNLQYDELAMRVGEYSNDSYVFSMNELIAEYNTASRNTEHTLPIVNDDLFALYNVFNLQKQLDEQGLGKQLRCFAYPKKDYVTYRDAVRLLGHYQIINTEERVVLLLRPKEFKKQRISLLGMKVLKGDYSIVIYNKEILLPKLDALKEEGEIYKAINEVDILTNVVQISF